VWKARDSFADNGSQQPMPLPRDLPCGSGFQELFDRSPSLLAGCRYLDLQGEVGEVIVEGHRVQLWVKAGVSREVARNINNIKGILRTLAPLICPVI
jgi:hypothetical protein